MAPQALLDHGLVQQLEDLGWRILQVPTVQEFQSLLQMPDPPIGPLKRPRLCGNVCRYALSSLSTLVILISNWIAVILPCFNHIFSITPIALLF